MNVTFRDLQQVNNPMNGKRLQTPDHMISLFQHFVGRTPFLFELCGDSGFKLTIGFAKDNATVQHSPASGLPPYLMAVAHDTVNNDECVEFLAGGTPTPVPRRFCLPVDLLQAIVSDFLLTGDRSEAVDWQEI